VVVRLQPDPDPMLVWFSSHVLVRSSLAVASHKSQVASHKLLLGSWVL
jgi:hypothetical protein